MIRVVLFVLCTLFLINFSRRALGNSRAHGFYRFFVFEGILLLLLLNYPYWFVDPFSAVHLLAWALLLTSVFFIVNSLVTLRQRGGHAQRHDMPENLPFENTVHLVETGLYRFVRHPMYSSLLFLAWGAFLKHISTLSTFLILAVSALLIAVAKVEERENIKFFGTAYEKYMQRTKMFIPGLL
ncbi:isoprenylcysteine carboxylmethyltransferase family protein [Desulforhopalus sp. IMCC35007]|uniref:methyltransferase family protein n=1 Tax=Desulforhopalus sp. IMCC35007 TaxID=2569543 RepID=UPI0010AE7C98|nr:isoprenylcysteine carboxylmethyltransferase family protein [Desulforhopalus sp. IMCC35007]TKB10835.1 isoprenylcysteine carboxylmethyltransferase family protein [Desulforhopalus sp. IMCC35007]